MQSLIFKYFLKCAASLNELSKISFQKENIFLFVKQIALHETLYKMNVQLQGLFILNLTTKQ